MSGKARIKVCGLTRAADAATALAQGADFLGVNCWPGSPRCVPAAARANLLREIPAAKRVAVTVNPSVAESPEAAEFRRRGADIIVFASPSAVESFLHQAAALRPDAGARQPKAVAIGATTADALRKAGIPLAGTAAAPTAVAIRNAVIEALA